MCRLCTEGWRFETVVLGGEDSGRVKAVLHPISASWEELYSQPSDGSVTVATHDPRAEDIWAGATGLYISQVLPDGSRRGRFGGEIIKYSGAGGGATTIAIQSLDAFLDDCIIAGKTDPWRIIGAGSQITVAKPTSPTAFSTVFTAPYSGTAAGFAAFLVNMARGNLIGEGFSGVKSLTASEYRPGAVPLPLYAAQYEWWDFKNIGAAIRDMVAASGVQSTKYRPEHTYSNGYWATELIFSTTEDFGVERNYTIQSDREAKEYGLEVDAQEKATRVYGIGSGAGANTQFSVAYDDDQIDNLPERRASVAWKDQTDPAAIDALTKGYVLDHRDPVTVPAASIMGLPDYDPDAVGYNPQKGFPGPEILRPGDMFQASIGYGVITVRELGVRALGVSWSLKGGSPCERVIAMQPLIRANQSVRTQTPAKPPAPTQPIPGSPSSPGTVDPWPTPGLVVKVQDDHLNEISGMEMSVNPNKVLLFNDEVDEYQLRSVDLESGERYAAIKFKTPLNATYSDPEAVRYSRVSKVQVLGDFGDNDNNRPTSGAGQPALHKFVEPKGAGAKTVTNTRLPLQFPNSERVNCETLLIHPTTDEVFLVSKEPTRARVFSFGPLSAMGTGTTDNPGTLVRTLTSVHMASDGTHTFDGDNVLLRCAGVSDTLCFQVSAGGGSWKSVDSLKTPAMTKSEAIAVESTCAFLTTTEIKNSSVGQAPIYRVLLTKALGAKCGTPSGSSGSGTGTPTTSTKTVPAQVLNMTAVKVTLPIGSGGKPKEVGPSALAKYEIKPWFYTDDGKTVVFRAPVDGVTTSNSGYPRSELRQLKNNGELAAWSNKNETWTMECELAFTHLPSGKPHVVGMQIHGDDNTDDLTVLRLEGSDLYVTKQDNTHYDLIDSSYTLGDWIKVKVVAKKGGGIDWYYNGTKSASLPGVYSGLYFKHGCYTQANESNGSGYGEVRSRAFKITRTL